MLNKYGMYVQANGGNGDATHRTGLVAGIVGLYYLAHKSREVNKLANLPSFVFENHNEDNLPKQVGTGKVRVSTLLSLREVRSQTYKFCRDLVMTLLTNCHLGKGIYIRHPSEYEGDWSSYPKCFSRDQASRVIFAYAVLGHKEPIRQWFKAMVKRGFLHQNVLDPVKNKKVFPDIMAAGEWRNLIRGLDWWFMYPVLCLLDVLFLGDIVFRSKWDGASLYVPDLKYAKYKYPTPVVFLADYLNDKTTWVKEMKHNHSLEKNGCIEVYELVDLLKEL